RLAGRNGSNGSSQWGRPFPKLALRSSGRRGILFSAMVGMARRTVPAHVVAGGTNIQAAFAIEGVAPLHAARTSQRDVPTTLNRYSAGRRPERVNRPRYLSF